MNVLLVGMIGQKWHTAASYAAQMNEGVLKRWQSNPDFFVLFLINFEGHATQMWSI